jgi:hypothetical protein
MITTSVDWKSDGFDFGSKTDELDWKDWKRLAISRLRAKLLRNRTFKKRQVNEDDRVRRFPHEI